MTSRKFLAEKIGLALLDRINNARVRKYLKLYTDSLYWSNDEIEHFQIKKIQELLKYSYTNSSFYKKRFDDANFNYQSFKYLDQLKSIPPLTRKDLQENLNEIVSKEFDLHKCKKGSSSGSTGTPIIYYHDIDDFSASKAVAIFIKMLGGYELGDKWLNIWGNPTAVNIDWKKFSSKVSKFLFNEFRVAAYRLRSNSQFKILIENLLRIKPKFIYGYTNAIYLLSEFLKDEKIKVDFVKGVFTTAENLHEYQRNIIECNLGKIFDNYGSSEINGVAAETMFDNGYSIISPRVHVEFDETLDQSNNSKKLLITSLDNKVLPFIRYENGDLAIPFEKSEISRKLNFPRFKSVAGRVSDIIELPNGGSLVVPSFFGSRMLKNVKGIVQYQIIKKSEDKIQINLKINNEFKEEFKEVILSTLKEYIPEQLKYELVFNQPIILSKNNKFKLLIDLTNQGNK